MAAPLPGTHRRLEELIGRVTLWLLIFFGAISLVTIATLTPHVNRDDSMSRLAIPLAVIVSSLVALFLQRRGWPRAGAALVIVAAYGAILNYVVSAGYGLHSYSLGIYAVLIVLVSLLLGPGWGLAGSAVALLTVAALYALERNGLMVNPEAVASIPLNNIVVAYGVLFVSMGAILYLFSKTFHESLTAAELQETRLRQMLDIAPLGYAVHRHERVLIINRVAAAITGREAASLTGMDIHGFVTPDQHLYLEQQMQAARAAPAGQIIKGEYRIRDVQGRDRLFETWTSPVDFIDGPALLTALHDITKERAAAAALAEAKTGAEAASQMKSQFLANMSHEIRTPMNAVLGLSELLTGSGLSGEQLKYARNIRNAANSLLDIVNDVLDVSRIEAGRLELMSVRFEPRALLTRVQAMLAPLAEAKGLALDVTVDASVPEALEGDEGRLRQILVNLAGNSIKFTERGRVGIALSAASGRAQTDGTSQGAAAAAATATAQPVCLLIRVTDTGVGITKEKLAQLFEPFVQVDDSATRRHGGAGLGLYIVRELAQQMGGGVSAHSTPGTGSRFEVELRMGVPARAAEVAFAKRRLAATGALALIDAPLGERALSVLLVEDNAINRMVARAILENAGHRVTEAVDGSVAVALHREQTFDCVLMDGQMPVMDGLEATRQIRERESAEGLRHTPIVALTANAMAGERERHLAAGMDDFLAKPYDRAGLMTVISRVMHAGVSAGQPGAAAGTGGAPTAAAPHAAASTALAAAQPGAEACFDAQSLEGLVRIEEQSPGLLADLLERFLQSTPALIGQIDGTLPADVKELGMAAHSLKGISGQFGARRVMTLAAQAERAAREGRVAEAHLLGATIRTEFARFEAEFRQHPVVARLLVKLEN